MLLVGLLACLVLITVPMHHKQPAPQAPPSETDQAVPRDPPRALGTHLPVHELAQPLSRELNPDQTAVQQIQERLAQKRSAETNSIGDPAVPVHDNPGENYRDNLGESLPSARVCVTLASISVPVRGQDAAQRHLGGRAGSAAGSGRRGQRMHNLLRFGRLRCDEPRRPDRFKIAREASLLWRTILEQPEVEESLRISRRMWLHAHDLRDFTFGSEQWCHDGA